MPESVPNASESAADTPTSAPTAHRGERRIWRWIRRLVILVRLVVLALLVAAVVTFPSGWGARTATAIARRVLAFGEPERTHITVERLSLRQLIVRDVALGGVPGEPAFDSLVVRYSPTGLLRRRIDSVELSPVRLDPATFTKTMPKAAPSGRASPPRSPDPLQGWRIVSLRAELAPVDFAPLVPDEARRWLPDAEVLATLTLDGSGDAMEARLEGRAFGGPLHGRLLYDPGAATGRVDVSSAPDFGPFRPERNLTADTAFSFACGEDALRVQASGSAGFEETLWRIAFSGEAEGQTFSAKVEREPATLDEDDPVLVAILKALPLPKGLSNLNATTSLSATASVVQTEKIPVPTWEVEAQLSETGVRAQWQETDLALHRGALRFAASGVGERWVLRPMRIGLSSAKAGRLHFEGGYATVLADEDSLLVSEAAVGFCGGKLRLFALSLDLKRMSSGFTILLDGLDAGKILEMFPEVGGTATGTLNGKIPLGLRNVSTTPQLRLRNAFLHAPPGETGKLCLANTQPVVDYLLTAGVPPPTCRSLGVALHNLDYTLLRLDFSNAGGDDSRLVLKLSGSSTVDKTKTPVERLVQKLSGSSTGGTTKMPVDLDIALNGDLERLLNIGIRAGSLR